MHRPSLSFLTLAGLALLFCLPFIGGCGKVGEPKPRQSTRSFVWQEVNINPAGKCLDVDAKMSGVYTNLNSVILELSGISGPEDCPGCPFIPTESYTSDNLSQIFNPKNGNLRFSYCPTRPAAAYRARLIGTNVFDTSRHAVSSERMVIMP